LLAGRNGHRENAFGRADRSVQGQLAAGCVRVKTLRLELSAGAQQAQSDRQVEGSRLFRQVGRREVDHNAVDGSRVAAVNQGPLDAMRALLDGRLGQSDQDRFRQGARRDINLDLDRLRVDPEERVGKEPGKHRPRRAISRIGGVGTSAEPDRR